MYKYERKLYINRECVFICIALITSLSGNVYQNSCLEKAKEIDNENYLLLQNEYDKLDEKYTKLEDQYEILVDEYNELYNRTNKWTSLGEFKISHYGGDCIGCSGKTATGTNPTTNRTIATDWSILPPGTEVMIGDIIYTVEDKGGAIKGNIIDIYVGTESVAADLGVYYTEVFVK